MNSLKRKRQSTTVAGKAANKKAKGGSSRSSNSSPPSSQSANVSAFHAQSLDHLINRPYVEYDPQRDDIGTSTRLMC